MLVGNACKIEFEGVALLEAITGLHVDRVDVVDRRFRRADDPRVLRGDLLGDVERRRVELVGRHHLVDRPEVQELFCGDVARRVVQRAHHVLRDETGEVRCGAECAAVDLRQPEDGALRRDDHVGIADKTDSAADAESVDGDDDRHLAVVDRGERSGAAVVGTDERVESLSCLHLLDVDARVESPTFGPQHHRVGVEIVARGESRVGQLEPRGRRQRVDRRIVDGNGGDTTRRARTGDRHAMPSSRDASRVVNPVTEAVTRMTTDSGKHTPSKCLVVW